MKEGKRVSAIATKFLPVDENLPSGLTGEDLMNHILDAMWNKDYCNEHKIDPLAELATPVPCRPTKWVFIGYLVYAFLGVLFWFQVTIV